MNTTLDLPISKAKNIGPTIAKLLNQIDIYSLDDLIEATPVNAYLRMSDKESGKHLPICYYLYSLQGAIMDIKWEEIPSEIKNELQRQVKIK